MNKPNTMTDKEKAFVKGALRRVFSRSELRKQVLDKSRVNHHDPTRPRVTKWSKCPECKDYVPTYLMEVDHISPVQRITETLADLTIEQLVYRIWCEEDNLVAICKPDHKAKSKAENAERHKYKKSKKAK